VESAADRAVLDVTVAVDAPVGVGGVRLATREGWSNVHLMLVDDLPVMPRTTEKITLPACVTGTFRTGESDTYLIDVKQGQRVSFEVVASRFGKDADPLLTIRDSSGQFIREYDNDAGLVYDCRLSHAFDKAGTYRIEVRDARYHGNPHHRYALRIASFPAGRVVVPAAVRVGGNALSLPETGDMLKYHRPTGQRPGPFTLALKRSEDQGSTWVQAIETDQPIQVARDYDYYRADALRRATSHELTMLSLFSHWGANPYRLLDPLITTGHAQATPVVVPGVLVGVLRQPGERHTFAMELSKGQNIHLRATPATIGSPIDIEVMVTDRFGREQRRSRDEQGEILLDFTAGQSGLYGMSVRDLQEQGGPAFAYQLEVREKPFPPTLFAEVEGLTIPQGTYQPIPIRIQGQGGRGPTTLRLLDAPPGVTLTPTVISEEQSSIIVQLHAAPTTPTGVTTLQIAAETSAGVVMVRTRPMIDRQRVNVDLIPFALREDQRFLPPALTDRFALQVVPSSPFTMELPDAVVNLARYQQVEFPIVTTRQPGFDAPIQFHAKGGQLADPKEGRTRVYAVLPEATPQQLRVSGSIYSKILSNLGQARIEVTGETTHQGRRICLTRAFTLNLSSAFRIESPTPQVVFQPGEKKSLTLTIARLPSFTGPVRLMLNPVVGVVLPEVVTIGEGQTSVVVPIQVEADAAPRKQRLSIQASALVGGYEEEFRTEPVEIEVRKVEPSKQ